MSRSTSKRAFLPLGPHTLPIGATPTSFLDHAAALHGVSREVVIGAAAGPTFDETHSRRQDWDFDLPARWARILEQAANLPPKAIQCVGAEERPWALEPDARGQFCPICFEKELLNGRLPHFEALWCRASLTHCPVHRAPYLLFGGGHGVKGGRHFPERWLNRAVGLEMDPEMRRNRLGRPSSIWRSFGLSGQANLLFDVGQRGFEWLDWGRLVTETFGACADTVNPRLAGMLEDWNQYVEFEAELNGLKPVARSVLAQLESGDQRAFIGDLYSLLTTRFTLLSDLAIEQSFVRDVSGPARVLLWGRWNRHVSLEHRFYERSRSDWRKERHVEVRRTALRQIMLDLQLILSCGKSKHGWDDSAERLVWQLASEKRCVILNVIASLDDEAYDWIVATQKSWPAPIRQLLSRVLSEVPRGRRNPLRQRERAEFERRLVVDTERRFLEQHKAEIMAQVARARSSDADVYSQ